MKRILLFLAGFLGARRRKQKKLYIRIEDDGLVKIGTCKRCVVQEQGRPIRAWDTEGDTALDFPRDRLVKRLAESGLQVEIEQEYVCP